MCGNGKKLKDELNTLIENYEVNVTLWEGRHLRETKANYKVVISIGKIKKKIYSKATSTECLIFNDYCIFPFELPLNVLLHKILKIKLYGKSSKKLIGSFNVDLATVWSQPNHQFYHKWAVLVDPTKPNGCVKAFIKCDIIILSKNTTVKKDEECGGCLEDNLLIPYGETCNRISTRVILSVYRADSFSPNLPKKKDWFYVKITYGDHVRKTSLVKCKKNPVWNEELIFHILFPPLIQYILIELCNRKNSLGNTTIDIRSLYEDGDNGFLPTFGPNFLYLYEPLGGYNRHKNSSPVENKFTYAARLLLSLRTEVIQKFDKGIISKCNLHVGLKRVPPIRENICFKYNDFILFAAIFDVLIFNSKVKKIKIQLTMGPKKHVKRIRKERKIYLKKKKVRWKKITCKPPLENPCKQNKTVPVRLSESKCETLPEKCLNIEKTVAISHKQTETESERNFWTFCREKLKILSEGKRRHRDKMRNCTLGNCPESGQAKDPEALLCVKISSERELCNVTNEKSNQIVLQMENVCEIPGRTKKSDEEAEALKKRQREAEVLKKRQIAARLRKNFLEDIPEILEEMNYVPVPPTFEDIEKRPIALEEKYVPPALPGPEYKVLCPSVKKSRDASVPPKSEYKEKHPSTIEEEFNGPALTRPVLYSSVKQTRDVPVPLRSEYKEKRPSTLEEELNGPILTQPGGTVLYSSVKKPRDAPVPLTSEYKEKRPSTTEEKFNGPALTRQQGTVLYPSVKKPHDVPVPLKSEKKEQRPEALEEKFNDTVLTKPGGTVLCPSIKKTHDVPVRTRLEYIEKRIVALEEKYIARVRQTKLKSKEKHPIGLEKSRDVPVLPIKHTCEEKRPINLEESQDIPVPLSKPKYKEKVVSYIQESCDLPVLTGSECKVLRPSVKESLDVSVPPRSDCNEKLLLNLEESSDVPELLTKSEFKEKRPLAVEEKDNVPVPLTKPKCKEKHPSYPQKSCDPPVLTTPECKEKHPLALEEKYVLTVLTQPECKILCPSVKESREKPVLNKPEYTQKYFAPVPLTKPKNRSRALGEKFIEPVLPKPGGKILCPSVKENRDVPVRTRLESIEKRIVALEERCVAPVLQTKSKCKGKRDVDLRECCDVPVLKTALECKDICSAVKKSCDVFEQFREGCKEKRFGALEEEKYVLTVSTGPECKVFCPSVRESCVRTTKPKCKEKRTVNLEESCDVPVRNRSKCKEKRSLALEECRDVPVRTTKPKCKGKRPVNLKESCDVPVQRTKPECIDICSTVKEICHVPERTKPECIKKRPRDSCDIPVRTRSKCKKKRSLALKECCDVRVLSTKPKCKEKCVRTKRPKDSCDIPVRTRSKRKKKRSLPLKECCDVHVLPTKPKCKEKCVPVRTKSECNDIRPILKKPKPECKEKRPSRCYGPIRAGPDCKSMCLPPSEEECNVPKCTKIYRKKHPKTSQEKYYVPVRISTKCMIKRPSALRKCFVPVRGIPECKKRPVRTVPDCKYICSLPLEENCDVPLEGTCSYPRIMRKTKRSRTFRKKCIPVRTTPKIKKHKQIRFKGKTKPVHPFQNECKPSKCIVPVCIKRRKEPLQLVKVITNCDSTTRKTCSIKKEYRYVKFCGNYPCVSIFGNWPNSLKRMYCCNVIKKEVETWNEEINKLKNDLQSCGTASQNLSTTLAKLYKSCQNILCQTKEINLCQTELSRERKRYYNQKIAEISEEIQKAKPELNKIADYLAKLNKYAQDPENSFPQTEIWLLNGKQKLSQHRIKTEDIAYSDNNNHRGIKTGKTQTILFRGECGEIIAKLEILFWFGLAKNFNECIKILPDGCNQRNVFCCPKPDLNIPRRLFVDERYNFQCKLHIYQGKIFFGFDNCGVTTTYVRVIFRGENKTTKTCSKTLNPIWDETIIFHVTLYGSCDFIKQNPPCVTVEIFGKIKPRKFKLIGRCFISPVIHFNNAPPVKLKWVSVISGYHEVGQILIAGELFEIFRHDATPICPFSIPVPNYIRPHNIKYKLQVFFWGVRPLIKLKNRIFVILDCGECLFMSPILRKVCNEVNFCCAIREVVVDMPEEVDYAPSINLRLFHMDLKRHKSTYMATCMVPSIRYILGPKNPCPCFEEEEEETIPTTAPIPTATASPDLPKEIVKEEKSCLKKLLKIFEEIIKSLIKKKNNCSIFTREYCQYKYTKKCGLNPSVGAKLIKILEQIIKSFIKKKNNCSIFTREYCQSKCTTSPSSRCYNYTTKNCELNPLNPSLEPNPLLVSNSDDLEPLNPPKITKKYESDPLITNPFGCEDLKSLNPPVGSKISEKCVRFDSPNTLIVYDPDNPLFGSNSSRSVDLEPLNPPVGYRTNNSSTIQDHDILPSRYNPYRCDDFKSLNPLSGPKITKERVKFDSLDNPLFESNSSDDLNPSFGSKTTSKSLVEDHDNFYGSNPFRCDDLRSLNPPAGTEITTKRTKFDWLPVYNPDNPLFGSNPFGSDDHPPLTKKNVQFDLSNPPKFYNSNDPLFGSNPLRTDESETNSYQLTVQNHDNFFKSNPFRCVNLKQLNPSGSDITKESLNFDSSNHPDNPFSRSNPFKCDHLKPQNPFVGNRKYVSNPLTHHDADNLFFGSNPTRFDDLKSLNPPDGFRIINNCVKFDMASPFPVYNPSNLLKPEDLKSLNPPFESKITYKCTLESVCEPSKTHFEPVEPEECEPDPFDDPIVDSNSRSREEANVLNDTDTEPDEEELCWWTRYRLSEESKPQPAKFPRIKIYKEELESQPEFNGFNDFLQNYVTVTEQKEKIANVKVALKFQKCSETTEKGFLLTSFTNDCLKFLVRVYVICGKNLATRCQIKKPNPYLCFRLGENTIRDEECYVRQNANPIFGKCYEFCGIFPQDYLLKIKVFNRRFNSKDELIGQTTIDLENRFYTKHHARCGIASRYVKNGWRDVYHPSKLLRILCEQMNFPEPIYEDRRVVIENYCFKTPVPDTETDKKEIQALMVLKKWCKVPCYGFHFVPEHIETRSLYHPEFKKIEQGRLILWVDIFPNLTKIPPKVDITPQTPIPMELRVIVWNVITDDKCLQDLYVKGWLLCLEESKQRTDTHCRLLNDEGDINWRFIFNFNYIPIERRMMVMESPNICDDYPEERKVQCKLEIQVWGSDAFGDDFLGTLILELCSMQKGAKLPSECTLEMPNSESVNLFKIKKTRGWWPFRRLKVTETLDNDFELSGKIDLELEILTEEEARNRPAERGKVKPNTPPNKNVTKNEDINPVNMTVPRKNTKSILKYFLCVIVGVLFIIMLIIVLCSEC